MKKKLIIIIIAIILLGIGFIVFRLKGNNTEIVKLEEKYTYKEKGTILEYTNRTNGGSIKEYEDYKYITLNANKKLVWGKKLSGKMGEKILSNKEFNSIVSVAFTKDFKALTGDISDISVKDGSTSFITIYYKNNTSFKTGGLNPKDELYNKVENKLNSLTK